MSRNLGQETERRILKKIGARRQPGSGAIPGFPNDGIKGRYLIEVKSTERKSLGLKREWLETLEENSISRSRIPALIIVFHKTNRVGGFKSPALIAASEVHEWVAIPRRDFERLSRGWLKT